MTIDRETVIMFGEEAGLLEPGYHTPDTAIPDLERFATLVLEHGRKPLPVSKDGMAVIIDGVPVPVEVVRRVEAAHGITNKESSDAEQ